MKIHGDSRKDLEHMRCSTTGSKLILAHTTPVLFACQGTTVRFTQTWHGLQHPETQATRSLDRSYVATSTMHGRNKSMAGQPGESARITACHLFHAWRSCPLRLPSTCSQTSPSKTAAACTRHAWMQPTFHVYFIAIAHHENLDQNQAMLQGNPRANRQLHQPSWPACAP